MAGIFLNALNHASQRQTAIVGIAVYLLIVTCSVGKARASEELTISTPDGPRTAIAMAAEGGPRPTVIVLHGATATSETAVRATGFAEAAARRDFTAVFPQGLSRRWNDARFSNPDGPDDVGFLRALVNKLVRRRIAKRGHVYLAGISNGGMMSFTMACRAGELFRGVGTVIASMPSKIKSCRHFRPMPLIMVNGTGDPLVPYSGGSVGFRGGRGDVRGVEQTAKFFAAKNGCRDRTERPVADRSTIDGTTVTRVTWSKCRTTKNVTLYRIEDGGHQIPGGRTILRLLLGRTNHDISAAEAIMSAFVREDARPGG